VRIGGHLAPKVGVQVMPKCGVLGLERFYERSYAYIGGKNNGNICAFSIGFMFTSHLHFFYGCRKGLMTSSLLL
jgi:hypothetical protein